MLLKLCRGVGIHLSERMVVTCRIFSLHKAPRELFSLRGGHLLFPTNLLLDSLDVLEMS